MSQQNISINSGQEKTSLLRESIQLYRAVEDIYLKLEQTSFETSSYDIEKKTRTLNDIFKNLHRLESRLCKHNLSLAEDETERILIKNREVMIGKICGYNRSLQQKAKTISSLLRHELNTLNTGHNAIEGYGPIAVGEENTLSGSF